MTRDEKPEIETSPLSGRLTSEGVTLDVRIHRKADPNERWLLEVIDHNKTSTVWDDTFATDRDAYAMFYRTLESDGAGSFLNKALTGAQQSTG